MLAVGGEPLLENSQFGKRRIGIHRTLAFAWRRAGGVLPVRGPAIGRLVAAALVTAALFASAVLAPALTLVPALALKTLVRRTTLVLARFANRRALGWSCCRHTFGRRIGAGLAELIVVAPSAPMPFVFCGFAGFTWRGGRRCAFRRTGLEARAGAVGGRRA